MTDRLSIGVVCFCGLSGSGVVASELALALARRGHRIHLMASARPSRDLPGSEHEMFHEVRVPSYPVFDDAPYTVAVACTIVDVVRRHGLDLLHVHYALPHAASALLARQVLGASAPRTVTTLHGTDVTRVGTDPAYHAVTAFAVAASDAITVPSDFLRREARRRLDLPREREIEVLPNFVDTAHFTPAEPRDRSRLAALFGATVDPAGDRAPVLFHVSTFREVKRTVDLIEVLARVRRALPARLVLVGDGPTRAATEERAAALGLSDCVQFLGRRAEFVEELRHADAFVLPSETESFGVAAAEALSAGVPVFAYRVGGLPEVVVEGTGRLVEALDVDALARAIVEVLGDPDRHAGMSRAARAHAARHFGEDAAVDRYEEFFQRVVARAHGTDR